jgi:hypothetical protein
MRARSRSIGSRSRGSLFIGSRSRGSLFIFRSSPAVAPPPSPWSCSSKVAVIVTIGGFGHGGQGGRVAASRATVPGGRFEHTKRRRAKHAAPHSTDLGASGRSGRSRLSYCCRASKLRNSTSRSSLTRTDDRPVQISAGNEKTVRWASRSNAKTTWRSVAYRTDKSKLLRGFAAPARLVARAAQISSGPASCKLAGIFRS